MLSGDMSIATTWLGFGLGSGLGLGLGLRLGLGLGLGVGLGLVLAHRAGQRADELPLAQRHLPLVGELLAQPQRRRGVERARPRAQRGVALKGPGHHLVRVRVRVWARA